MLALAAFVLVGVAVVLLETQRAFVDSPPSRATPTLSRDDPGAPLPSEAEIWGRIWSRANGAGVLRPTWLPKSSAEYAVLLEPRTPPDGPFGYGVRYIDLRTVVGRTVWSVEFFADALDGPARGIQQFGGTSQAVNVRGHAAELFGNGSPGWTVVWTEGSCRYAMQAFDVSRDDLARIIDALAPVIDASGRTMPFR